MSLTENTNRPDQGKATADQLARDYAELAASVTTLLDEARELPALCESDEVMGQYAKVIKRLRDLTARIGAYHDAEKEPFLRGGQAVDRFFFGLWERCAKRNRTDKPGAADVLQGRVDAYMIAKAEAERRKREDEARRARQAEEAARREAEQAEQARREAEAKAARTRNEERLRLANAASVAAAEQARISREAEEKAAEVRREAELQAMAKPADLAGTRVSDDTKVTLRREYYAEVTDVSQLDGLTLWPFVSDEAKAQALRRWAQVTQHKRQMSGAAVGYREKSRVL